MKQNPHRENPHISLSGRMVLWFLVACVVAGGSLAYAKKASAGWQGNVMSFVSGLVHANQASANIPIEQSASNSQTMDVLEAASNSNPNPIACSSISPINGSILDPDIAGSDSSAGCEAQNTDIGTYIVQSGDTIGSIAKMFNISETTIKQANHLTNATIRLGQVLTILPRSGIIYSVKKGDTLGSIAKRYKVDVSDILSYNSIASSSLAVGVAIMIPDAQPLPGDLAQVSQLSRGSSHTVPAFEPLLDNISNLPTYSSCSTLGSGCYYVRPIVGGRISQGLHGHNAVDLAAPAGTPIRAAADGTVIIDKMNNAWNGGYGNYIVISHDNGSQTLYGHMQIKSKGLVSVGDHVSQGDIIGYIGMTGLTTGPHVHFEIRGARNLFADPSI